MSLSIEAKNEFKYEIYPQKAEKSISSSGKPIKTGAKKDRLVFPDNRLNIALASRSNKIFDAILSPFSHHKSSVKASIDGVPLTLNVKSLERLNIVPELITSGEGSPEQLGLLIKERYKTLSQMHQEYDRLKAEGPTVLQQLEDRNLLKLVHCAWGGTANAGEMKESGIIVLNEPKGKQTFAYTKGQDNHHVYAFPLNCTTHPYIEQLGKKLGGGHFSQVFDVEGYTKESPASVLKIARLNIKYAHEDLLKESKIVHKLHRNFNGDQLALMPPPIALFNIDHISPICAALTTKFNHNGSSYFKSYKPTLYMYYKLFTTLEITLDYIHKQEIYHGDIKPDNMYYDEETQLLKFLDFGSCLDGSENRLDILKQNNTQLLAWSADYCFRSNLRRTEQFAKDDDFENYKASLAIRDKIALKLSYLEGICSNPNLCTTNVFNKLFTYTYLKNGNRAFILGISKNVEELIDTRIKDDEAKIVVRRLIKEITDLEQGVPNAESSIVTPVGFDDPAAAKSLI